MASASAVAVQSDGKIVVVGQAQVSDDGDYDFAVTRLGIDGKLDVTFGTGGKAVIAFNIGGGNGDFANAVAIQPDGKIVLAGNVETSSSAVVH